MARIAQIMQPATSESSISLKAAFLALPECFIQLQGKVY
jgi:hypothetical protein